MEFFRHLLLYIGVASMACLVAGLYRPWIMLWWEDVQNRRKVIRLYGAVAALSISLYWILGLY